MRQYFLQSMTARLGLVVADLHAVTEPPDDDEDPAAAIPYLFGARGTTPPIIIPKYSLPSPPNRSQHFPIRLMSLCERSVAAPFLFGGWSSAPPIIPEDEAISSDDSSFPNNSSLAPINRMRHRDYALFRSHTQLGSSPMRRNYSGLLTRLISARGFSTSAETT
ncbi:hypothetical protein ABZP36_035600 [Zizania latifolia]